MSRTKMTTLAFLLLDLSPLVLFEIDFSSALTGIHFGIFGWYLAEM